MQETFVIMGVAASAFLSTNVDNLFLLLGYFAAPKVKPRNVVLGYLGAVVAARWLMRREAVRIRLERVSKLVLPLLLIGVGLYILADTVTDTLR